MGPAGLHGNVFAKFALTGDAAPLWRDAARELAVYAAEVCVVLRLGRAGVMGAGC